MRLLPWLLVALLLASPVLSADVDEDVAVEEEEVEGPVTCEIEHAFGDGPFTKRGSLQLKSASSQFASLDQQLPESFGDQLYELAKADGLYRVRVRQASGANVLASVRACALYASGARDKLVVHVDSAGHVQSVNVVLPTQQCDVATMKKKQLQPKTSVVISRPSAGPEPFLEDYVKELERRQNPQRAAEENQSFLGKYWMYILPLVLYTLMSGGGQQAPAGGAAGGAAAAPARS
eukprot:m.211697 g.211697  ORF g.211697 m.211697 type:complete len:235 (-) comp18744_c0_seq1:149-853(-)